MGKKLGNDYRLWIESATPGTYNEIKGQVTLKVNRQTSLIDTSTKDDGAYGTSAPAQKSVTIDVEMKPNLPDANGYTRYETQALASPQVATNFEIRKGGAAGNGTTDVVFRASMYIGNLDTDFGQNDVVKATSQLSLAAAPTVDLLA